MDHETTLTTPASYVAALIGFAASLDWEKAIYIVLAVSTFAINWYYQHQRHQREQRQEQQAKRGNRGKV